MTRSKTCCGLLALLLASLGVSRADAHKPSDSYLTLTVDGSRASGQWDIALRDLDHVVGLDSDADGVITWGEVRARHSDIAAYALARLELTQGEDRPCSLAAREHLIDRHTDGAYAVLRFSVECADVITAIAARYTLLFDVDPQHRGVVQIVHDGTARTLLFTADRKAQQIDFTQAAAWTQTVVHFWRDGVWHIWIGYDHILFLLALLMPAVLRREQTEWHVREFRDALAGTVKVVTAFTLAHSITLTLAAVGAVNLPVHLVESTIAASVVVAALNNIWPILGDRGWLIGFAFGLLHGFGFANVLADTDISHSSLVHALFGFHLGVESGQLAIVCLFLPLAYAARRTWAYQRLTLVIGSALIALLAMIWFIERAFDISMLS